MSNFSVRRVEDPTIYVRRNKPDILGSAWDNIVDFKDALNRLEDNIAATDIRLKPVKKTSSYNGPVLKEISSETQHFGKVTRFQLLGDKSGYKGLPKHSASAVEIKTRRNNVDHSKTGPVSDISSIKMDTYSKLSQGASGRNGYSPNRYTVNGLKSGGKIHDELPSFFKTTTVNPVILNDSSLDSNHNKESSFINTTVNSSTNSQQFSLSSSPSFHGKAVLAKNEAALQKIKEKVQKQKAMLSKPDEKVCDQAGDRKLHDSKDEISTPSEVFEKVEMNQVPLKRKVGAVSSSGPTYRGFNSVSGQKTSKKGEKRKHKVQQSAVIKSSKESKGLAKPVPKPENKLRKARMNRIIGSRCPKEVTSTTSWRDGQATVKKILGSKKIKAQSIPDSNVPAEKTDTTYNVSPRSQEELSEGKLSDEDGDLEIYSPKDEVESNIPKMNEVDKHSEILSHDSDVDNEEKLKDVLSTEAQSMLADLAQDSSESECEMKEDEKPKATGQSKKAKKERKLRTVPKPTVEEKYPKEKSRHYDQTEVQKYMAQQMAERKKKQKEEKILKKKQEEEKQRRLKDLYARQKKSFAGPKKEKRFGLTFTSTDNEDLRIPGHEVYEASNEEYEKFDQRPTLNESDKENTDVNDVEESSGASFNQSIDGTEDGNISTDDVFSVNEQLHDRAVDHVIQPAPSLPLNQRAQRLTALKATALALQSRLQSQALRLSGGTSERVVSQPGSTVVARPKDEETGFQGALPGIASIRKQARANERQSTRVEAATKIQAAYRGHTVRKRFHWHDGNDVESDENSVVSSIIEKQDNHMRHHDNDDEQGKHTEGSADDIEYAAIRPLYKEDRLNDLRTERTYFRHADIADVPFTHFSVPSVQYEPRGDRYSVMNIFTRRHPTIAVEDILDERPGSETASLLDAGEGVSRKSDGNVEYEDDFTDEDISTASVLTDQELNKESPSASRPETYSECFESDEEQAEVERKDSTLKENIGEQLSERSQSKTSPPSPLSSVANGSSPENKDGDDIIPIMTSTMHPEEHHSSASISLSDYSEPFRQPVFIRPVQRTGGDRLSPGSLQRKLTAEINLLENVEDSVRQVNDIEKTRVVSLAQQETVSLAQILKENHDQEMQNLRLKAKDEAIQAAKDLEKTRQAAAMAAASAAEKLAEVQNEAMKTNAENSRKYVEEASRLSSGVLSGTAHQLAEFCKSVTTTTSAAVQDLHKINRPTTTLVERATSFSEGHAVQSENSSKSDEHTRTSDVYSNQSKSWETSPSVTSGRQQGGYSSDEFESYKSRTAAHEVSQIKTEPTRSASLSVESILEDLPDKSASDDDTTVNEESANDTQSPSTEKPKKTDKVHRSVSPLLDYSSQFEDSSHALTDDDIDFRLFPSREHRRKSIKRIKDDSFDEDKGKKKVARTPFESDDSFGKFTVDMIQQYMREEEVRTRHQGAILRLREKSLKEKTKAELQWLEQLKKQSRDKGSDDVMPSIKKRERGILMKLKAGKEEIKCLRAANRAASFQRRFMIYQQQEIHRLHQATMNIREKIQKNVSKKSSPRSSYDVSEKPSQDHPETSSPLSKTTSNTQWSRSDSLSKANKISATLPASPSAKSVSEDINEEQGTSHASPVVSASSFPSYSTPKSETSKVRKTEQAPTEPETSTILNMLSFLESGEQELSNENGERLLKIHKMLVERQQKLVKDESEVKNILQKVTEMINNQRNVIPRSSHGNHTSESARTPATISDVKQTKDGPSELFIPEDLSSVEEIISEEIKENSEKSASDYANCTFDTDETTTSRRETVAQASKQSSEAQIDEEPLSLTETSDHSDYEDRIRKLKEEIQREKMKADALEKKKRKMKRSAMRQEVLNLEKELKNTRDDIHRKMAEIKTAGAVQASSPPSSMKSSKSSVSSQKERKSLSKRENGDISLRNPSERITSAQESSTHDRSQSTQDRSQSTQDRSHTTQDRSQSTQDRSHTTQETSHTSSGRDRTFVSSVHEVEESLIEILDSPRVSLTLKDTTKASAVLDQNEASDVSEEISEHVDSDSRSATSIPEESGIANGEQELESKASDIQEEISERSYTEPQSSTPSISEEIPSIVDDLRDSHGKTPDDEFEHSYTETQSDSSIPEDLEGSDEKIPGGPDEEFEHSYTEPQSNTSIPERTDEKTPGVSDSILQHSDTERRSKPSVSKDSDEVPEHSHTEPRGSTSIYDESPTSYEKRKESRGISEQISSGRRSDTNVAETTVDEELDVLSDVSNISVVSENLPAGTEREDHSSEKSNVLSGKSNVLSEKTTSSRSPSLEKDSEEFHDVTTSGNKLHDVITSENEFNDVITSEKESHDVIISENELNDVITSEKSALENSKSLVKSAKSGEKESESRSQSESSSIAEEIASGYEDEDVSDLASMKEESEELIFGGLEKADETDGGVKESVNEEYTDTFKHTAAEKTSTESKTIEPAREDGGEEKTKSLQSERSESKLLSARELGTKEQQERADQESEDEKEYSEDFEVDDATLSEDIPEILESDEDQVESENENSFKVFKSDDRDVRGTRNESETRGKGVLDDITDDIYRGIVEDSVETVRSAKNAKSRRITEERMLDEALEEKGEDLTDKVDSRTIDTDSITKNLLADAILQMIAIKRRKKDAGKTGTVENEAKHFETPTTKPPSATSPLGVIPGFGSADEQTVFGNALQIAKSNQTLDDDALKTMDEDIEGLLGTSLDDDDDEDFPVKQNKFNDIPLDDTEPSVHEYPPMFAVPHNLQEMTSIANSTVDILLAQKREEMPLENCEPPAQLLGGETENELDSESIRSYRNLIFDLTKEVFMDTISQDEVASRPPWAKAKWKGGQKLSRNFRRWKSDDEVRVAVMERVSNLIGLGAPRTTMQTLQRKTPVRGNKKDNVDAILIEELRQEEPQWTDYEEDETTVKFQVADAILNMLLDDTVRVFNAIQAKKNVPDNVLVV